MADMTSVYQITGVDGLSGPAGTADAALGRLEATGSRVGSVLGTAVQAGAVAAAAGLAAIGAGIAASISSATSFEQSISHIGAVAGASGTQMQALSATALDLGKATAFSATQAASGMEELIKAGVSITDVIGGGARAALDLAAAGGVSVAEAATIASNAMNVFSVDGANAGHVADVIAGAANASAIDVHDFGFSLSAVGAVAATVGVSLEDTATAIAVLGQAGLKGSDAGTSLKTMLLNLTPSSASAKAEFAELGLETFNVQKAMDLLRSKGFEPVSESIVSLPQQIATNILGIKNLGTATKEQVKSFTDLELKTGVLQNAFFNADGSIKSMAEVAQVLQDSMKGLTKEQQLSALQTAFGTDAIRAAAIMAKAGAAGFNDMADAEGKVTAQAVGMERLNNLAGDIEQLKGSLETAAITIGTAFLPALRSMAQGATQFVNQAIDVIGQLPAAWQDVMDIFTSQSTAGNFEGLLERLGLSEATVVMIDDWLGQIGDAWRTVGAVFANNWSPSAEIAPLVNAIGIAATVVRDQLFPAVRTAFGWVMDNWRTIAGGLAGVGVALAGIWAGGAAAAGITAVALGLAALLTPIGLVVAASAALGVAWANDWGGIQEKTADFLTWFKANLPAMQAGAQRTFSEMTAFIQAKLAALGDLIKAVGQAMNGDWAGAWATMTEIVAREQAAQLAQSEAHGTAMTAAIDNWTGGALTSITTWTIDTATAISTWVTGTALAIITWVTDTETMFTTWGTDLLAAITGAWTAVTTTITTAWTTIETAFALGIAAVQLVWQAGWDAVGAIVTAAWNLITPENQAKIQELLGIFGELWTTAQALWAAGTVAITTLVTTWWTEISTLWTTTTAAITAVVTAWWTAISEAWAAGTAAVTAIIGPWWTAIEGVWNAGHETVGSATSGWWTAIQGAWETGTTAIGNTIGAKWAEIVTATSGLFERMKTAFDGAVTTLGEAAAALGKSIIDAIVGAINTGVGAIATALTTVVKDAIKQMLPSIPGAAGGGGGGGGGVSATPLSYRATNAGGFANNEERLAFIGETAARYGHNPAKVQQGARFEGAGPAGPLGDYKNGQPMSFGGLQAYTGGGQGNQFQAETGLDPRDPNNEKALLDWQIRNLGRTGWAPFHGPTNAGFAPFEGLNVAPPQAPLREMQRIPLGPNPLTGGVSGIGGWTPNDMQAVIDLAPPWERAMEQVQTSGEGAFTGVTTASATLPSVASVNVKQFGDETMTSITDASGVMVSTIQDATGKVVAEVVTMADGTQVGMSAMGEGIQTSSQQIGDSTITTFRDMAGNTVSTMTDAGGKITGQWTGMANGVTSATTTLATDVTTDVTGMATDVVAQHQMMATQATVWVDTMGTGITTSMTDASGNMVTLSTDMSGSVVGWFGTMSDGATANVTQMGDEVLTTFTNLDGSTTNVVTDMAGNVVLQWTQMRDDVTGANAEITSNTDDAAGQIADAGQQVGSTLGDMGQAFKGTGTAAKSAVRPIEELATAAASVKPINMGDTVKNLQAVEKQAKSAAKALTELGEAGKNVSGSGGSGGGGGTGGGRKGGGDTEGFQVGGVLPEDIYGLGPSGRRYRLHGGELVVPNAGPSPAFGMPDQQTQVTLEIDYDKLARAIQKSTKERNYNLIINTNAPYEPITQDFAMLEAMARRES